MAMACANAETSFFGPLTFPEPSQPVLPFGFEPWEEGTVNCVLCADVVFSLPDGKNDLLAHLYMKHKIVISDVDSLASLQGYLDYWRIRLRQTPLDKICLVCPQDNINYHLMSDVNPEDMELRKGLITKRLEWVLEWQRKEREEGNYGKGCLFCRYTETGTRCDYLTHLSYQHNLQLGRPHNLVFVDRLIAKIEKKLINLECIYCEHHFRDRDTLKEHMRKKFHKRINPKNKEYDRFYMRNYLEGGDVDEAEAEDAWSQWRDEGSDWSDWQEEPSPIVCLFCTQSYPLWEQILTHMTEAHMFSYKFVMGSYNFYQQLKIVNFIRREVHLLRCYDCKLKFADRAALTHHLNIASHCTIPDRSDWDHPEFFFPTYENDTFLSMLEDSEDDPVDRLTSQMEVNCTVASSSQ